MIQIKIIAIKIIAEAGCNWTTIMEAKQMIIKTRNVGCWAAKFQLFTKEMAKKAKIPEYLSLSKSETQDLFEYGKRHGIEVFFTPMYPEAVDWCEEIGVNYYKIRYKDRHDYNLIEMIKETKKPYFISMELEDNPKFGFGYEQRKVLFCKPYYPCGIGDYVFNSSIIFDGVSDHTKDLQLLKIALDTKNINPFEYWEKHMCLTKDCLESEWSVTFEELAEVLRK